MSAEAKVAGDVDVLREFATPEFRRDPYPYFRWLRENEPVCRTSEGFYLVTRHADVTFVQNRNGDLFVSPEAAQVVEVMPQIREHQLMEKLLGSLASLNPPAHTRLRRLVARVFTPRNIDGFRDQMAVICGRLLDAIEEPLRDGEVVDLREKLSGPLPMLTIAELLGVPGDEHEWLMAAARTIFAGVTASAYGDWDAVGRGDESTAAMEEYFIRLAEDRRRAPRKDLVSGLVQSHDEDRLSNGELSGLIWLLWVAGTDTTSAGMDHCVWTVAGRPEMHHWLQGDAAQATAYVDEVLRMYSPGLFSPLPKIALQDVELSGRRIPAGSDVRVAWAAGNRDPEVFPDPDRFDPTRDTGKTLTLGGGMHHCLGRFLARAELSIATTMLHQRFPTLTAESDPEWCGIGCDISGREVPVTLGR
jgi:cytochrome P450